MIESLISFSLRNRFLVLLVASGLFAWGIYSVKVNKIDAIPDLSENQVIVFTEWMGRSPQIIEDQVTYPLVTNLQGLPEVKYVRGSSMFGMSFVYVIFNNDTALFSKADGCEMEQRLPPCHRHTNAPCCDDETLINEADDFKASVTHYQPATPTSLDAEQPLVLIAEIIPAAGISRFKYYHYDPPLRSHDLTVAHRVFLI